MAAGISQVFNSYRKDLPNLMGQRALLGGVCSSAFQFLKAGSPTLALGAGVLATVASLVDSCLRPLIDECLKGNKNSWVVVGAYVALVAGALVGGTAITSACGFSVAAFKMSEMVALNLFLQIVLGVGREQSTAIPYLVVA